MAADVSVEALQKVKQSTLEFEESVFKISADIVSQNEEIMSECKDALLDTKQDLDDVIKTIQNLEKQIQAILAEISHANTKVRNLTAKMEVLEDRLGFLDNEIDDLQNQRTCLEAQLSRSDSEEKKKQIQQQINEVQGDISDCHLEQGEIIGDLSTAESQIEALQSKISDLEAERAKDEQKRDTEILRKRDLTNKLERMQKSFSYLKADIDEYTGAVKKFEKKSISKTSSTNSAIDKCITAIESYLAVNLASGFVASSGGLGNSSGGGLSEGALSSNLSNGANSNTTGVTANIATNDVAIEENNNVSNRNNNSYSEDVSSDGPKSTVLSEECRLANGAFVRDASFLDENGCIKFAYTDTNGCIGEEKIITLRKGMRIIRFGSERGFFFAPEGTDFRNLSLPYVRSTVQFRVYEITRDIPFVFTGEVAPDFGEPGGGTQFRTLWPAYRLEARGYIQAVTPEMTLPTGRG